VQRGYKEDNWGNRPSSVREAAKKKGRRKETVGGERSFREDVKAEAEESTLLEAVTRKRLVTLRTLVCV
jgi:hypothetical protein